MKRQSDGDGGDGRRRMEGPDGRWRGRDGRGTERVGTPVNGRPVGDVVLSG